MEENMNDKKLVELVGALCLPYIDDHKLTSEERNALLEVIHSKPDIPNMALELILHTGLRPSEAVAMMRSDVNFEEGVLTVARAEIKCRIPETQAYCYTTIDCPGKCSEARTLVLSDEAIHVLEDIIRTNPRSEFLFALNDKRLTWDGLSQKLRCDCREAGIPRKHPAALRMSYAIDQMIDGVDLETILTRLGVDRQGKERI